MDTTAFDTKEGIEKYLKDGISGLHQLGIDRRKASGYGKMGPLEAYFGQWILIGHWYLDSIGNISHIIEGGVEGAERVVPYVEFFKKYEVKRISSTMSRFPGTSDLCPQCQKGWELRNLHQYRLVRVDEVIEEGPGYRFFHPECEDLKHTQAVLKLFRDVYKNAGLSAVDMRLCRNEYGSASYRGPWTLTETPAGLIRMGWRKNVLEIDWSLCRLKKEPDFTNEDVTKGTTYIHAWSYEKATQYIKVILSSL